MKNINYIGAGAGSGKTYRLTHDLARLIEEHKVQPEEVILTTFTKKAAAELRERAKAVLYEKGLFDEAERLDQALISTIHSIAYTLIQKYWYHLGLSPKLNVMEEETKILYVKQSMSQLPTDEEIEFLAHYRDSFGISKQKEGAQYYVPDETFWLADLNNLINEAEKYEITDFKNSYEHSLSVWSDICKPNANAQEIDNQKLRECLESTYQRNENDGESKAKQDRRKEISQLLLELNDSTVRVYHKTQKFLSKLPKKLTNEQVSDAIAMIGDIWNSPVVDRLQRKYIGLLSDLAERWTEEFRLFKKEHNLVDYNDMEYYLLELLNHKEAREEISESYNCLMVDEFQDSSPVQVRAFVALSELVEHNYWVGDGKQAIYGFRGTDITLTNAVMEIISEEKNGNKTHTLNTNYRSVPSIVEATNKTFKPVFSKVMSEDRIILKPNQKVDVVENSLALWYDEASDMASYIEQTANRIIAMIDSGTAPKDIAVIARTNSRLFDLANQLSFYGIPINAEGSIVVETGAFILLESMIRLVIDESDTLARAQIAFLTEEGYRLEKLIDDKLEYDHRESDNQGAWLDEIPLIHALLTERERLQHYSASALVESLAIEFGLVNRSDEYVNSFDGKAIFDAVLQSALEYEQYCLQMTLPSTLSGFLDYIADVPPVLTGDREGVNLVTYHRAKGLEWKNVVLLDLDYNHTDEKLLLKRNLFGIHASRIETPSRDNLFPEAVITVLPWIFHTQRKVPDEYLSRIQSSEALEKIISQEVEEAARLLYVGMTRAKEKLILACRAGNKPLRWFEQIGLNPMESIQIDFSMSDCLSIGVPFALEKRPMQEYVTYGTQFADEEEREYVLSKYPELKKELDAEREEKLRLEVAAEEERAAKARKKLETRIAYAPLKHYALRDIYPSEVETVGKVELLLKGKERIVRMGDIDDARVGNCIHQMYCAGNVVDDERMLAFLKENELHGHLTSMDSIKKSWSNLVDYLTSHYGSPKRTQQEVPFKRHENGQIISGEIDMLWETDEGVVIIDFKTYSGKTSNILDCEDKHFAGRFKGQLDCYKQALTSAGKKVIDTLLYYPILGDLLCLI
ncbi:UvrD-helicase domain-containing protein [Porphyromonas levii]|uniref:UvrD-helicase domain-containing protein n=1 Tax=Porphyromonas levii TaxID=28114 RepID=UPI001B8C0EA1|nr:UvrD-helicase domain-containing protein [Porphyromonas levii]MBR8764146.1 ATP-dependent helicase/nuclease subunit A [Porphyromonas levii]MBR8774364.1 ATP-dependent helicase/nuclease subunit A [Porphyromonas levii]MBR8807268.1 ATP-dependent helicase/nuclease subunit A [Porphyromonas levii]